MPASTRQLLRQEAALLGRFTEAYRQKFTVMIDQLNESPDQVGSEQCMRLCLETLGMLLSTQSHLVIALATLEAEAELPPLRQAA